MESIYEQVMSIFDRMENKLNDILNKNLEKVEDKEKLKEAIEKALDEVRKGRDNCKGKIRELSEKLEKCEISFDEFEREVDECVKSTLEEAKKYLGKDYTGLKTAKATFSRCTNVYKKKVYKKIAEQITCTP
ncbi:hypothetical protein IPA_08910 [Ignicoccus pacificus DSM 13166]|uniref:Uncharacterized protein n=1 Tax=Ignicoccus pacificus DSM 13166 TaxID=940294 RepID=A0A977KBY6_9CREN|nr:hypothetical protein IPA_08910 [Ignicoccus pacificus DSM 13166]